MALRVNKLMHSVAQRNSRSYSVLHVHFYDYEVPRLLKWILLEKSRRGHFSVLDLGCGDGMILLSLQFQGLLKNVDRVVGVDMSEVRIRRLVENVSGVTGLVSDACKIEELDDGSFDVIICSQLIEHVSNDHALLREIRRLLKEDGYVYISSVIKKPYGFWLYRRDGQFGLDPTHVREYPSKEAFLLLLEKEGFNPRKVSCDKLKYSVADLLVRALITIGLYESEGIQTIFPRRRLLTRFRKLLELPVLGYERIEVFASLKPNL
jgi:SAM-dependent methyltransferase